MKLPTMGLSMPKKPVRLHLQPQEALALYVVLEQAIDVFEEKGQQDLTRILESISGNLYDYLEATFDDA
jgi:hypothetical protein